jgi:hypothetical protein
MILRKIIHKYLHPTQVKSVGEEPLLWSTMKKEPMLEKLYYTLNVTVLIVKGDRDMKGHRIN